MTLLCQIKDIRNSLRRCQNGEVPDHVELFEIKGYLQRLSDIRPLLDTINETAGLKDTALHDPAAALDILDPNHTGSRGLLHPRQRHPEAEGDPRCQEGCGGAAVPRPDRRGKGRPGGSNAPVSAPRRRARR